MRTNHPIRLLALGMLIVGLGFLGTRASAENALSVGSASVESCETASIGLFVSGDKDVEGFVMAFDWDGTLASGMDLVPATGSGEALENAEMIVKRVESSYMILSVVMDVDGKGGEKIPAGDDTRVGTAKIRCGGCDQGTTTVPLTLADGEYSTVPGGPILDNIIVSEGLSIGVKEGLALHNGKLTCKEGGEPPGPEDQYVFACGGEIAPNNKPSAIEGARKTRHTVSFYYKAPDRGEGNRNKIQGLSMAVKYHCDLSAIPESFSTAGGALEQVDAEFVHIEIDNIAGDGDPCELTLGVLVDAVAPYDGRTLPPTSHYLKVFSLDFEIEDDAECDSCLWLRFADELNGNGDVFVYNLVSVNFFPEVPTLYNCEVCVKKGQVKFVRGDCNFDSYPYGGKRAIDISDAAAMVGNMFLTGVNHFDAPCEDACDSNDDGALNAADIVFILNYLFVPASPVPPPPGPKTPGFDPTEDDLGCEGGTPQC